MEINDYMRDLSSQSVYVLDKVKDGVKSQRDSPMDLQSLEPYEPGLRSNNRSLVFCGKRAAPIYTQVLTLRQLCQKVLYDHIDCVEHVGLAPYDLMEPILKKCTAEQLEKFEFYNQHMISETDDLWMHHCKRTFPNKRLDEMETWREVYMDGQQERKAKLEKCVELIGASSAKVKNEVNKVKFIDACIVPTRRRGGWGGQQSSASNGNTHFNGGRPKQGTSLASSKGGQKQMGHLMKKTLQMIGGAKRR
ncbi:hypothetical protein HELRODRAFT_191038 [Helobdella robusta]|uniref:Elongin-A n=1 Tax=Helobdella robusta TaxID=6412 RepID=T1FSJ0_HELRO|nr:hypothetical protein HELRODRAFT_191038 [Helobdella robusta]ESO07782.1 hypothetical protein HELRODRAFT_191038 [Helobdella robusta]